MKRCLLLAASLLVVAGCQRRSLEDPANGSCEIRFSAGGLDVSGSAADRVATKATEVLMTPDSTVRVIARRRASGQTSADPSQGVQVAEATYKVQADGTTLVPCKVDDDGKEVALGAGETAKGIELGNGSYDFYAYSPARKLGADEKTVSGVSHGIDWLGCVKTASVSRTNSKVELLFDHKCSKLSFTVKFDDAMVGEANQGLEVKKVTLSGVAPSPVNYTIGSDLTPGTGAAGNTFVVGVVDKTTSGTHRDPTDTEDQLAVASGIVLPKTTGNVNGEFVLTMGGKDYTLKAKDLPLTFEQGKHYTFTMISKRAAIELVLTVSPWNEATWGDATGIGGYPEYSVIVGTWVVPTWGTGTDLGAGGESSEITGGGAIGTWVPNSWNGDVGV
ncbi:MAG: fimbrillin family protein [Rikenella sp.]|nr:fimbrillin family protein [Rikenella sp.]